MSSERITPPAMNYDNILPLAIESRSNRREFRPTNGATFSNSTGATHIRIDVNADSMLDALNSYLSVDITNEAVATNFLGLAPFGPAFIQRLRIESGGVVIEDIDEYSRLYAMTSLCQCPQDYLKNNYKNMGMYQSPDSDAFFTGNNGAIVSRANLDNHSQVAGADPTNARGSTISELQYPRTLQSILSGTTNAGAEVGNNAANIPTASAVFNHCKIASGQSKTLNIPLMSGFLNMDKYIPLIMMNAGFTIDIEIVSTEKIGVTTTEASNGNAIVAADGVTAWRVDGVKYVAHLIDLDRSFYDRLRVVMEDAGGVLQMAGQTYRHYVGQMATPIGPHTITLPARVKSVKSIFATFHRNSHYGVHAGGYSQSVFQNANMSSFRFEIGSVRYPQNDINCLVNAVLDGTLKSCHPEFLTELSKAFGKLGDYQHQVAFNSKNLSNVQTAKTGLTSPLAVVDAYILGYDFEAFNRVALEAGINTADRSLPINFICSRSTPTAQTTRADFYVLTDAIYYINVDGTVSVSV
tara:strand:+ start:1495 stop:3066 length:1572 start_codon:yes stop_codon:yes gene_type:complete